jgi:hypothetical protein
LSNNPALVHRRRNTDADVPNSGGVDQVTAPQGNPLLKPLIEQAKIAFSPASVVLYYHHQRIKKRKT